MHERLDPEPIVAITKKYLIDLLNSMCFANTICWGGIDQFNELPIFTSSKRPDSRNEQRGALLVHNKMNTALRLLVTIVDEKLSKVCYRVAPLKALVALDQPKRVLLPLEYVQIDVSMADLNLGLRQDSSCTFSLNLDRFFDEKILVFGLLQFVLDSSFYSYSDREVFEDLLDDVISYPPVPGDGHYKPVYAVTLRDDSL